MRTETATRPSLADEVRELTRQLLCSAQPTDELDRATWSRLEQSGITDLMRAEADGGGGATWVEFAAALREVGAAGASVPLAEHAGLAGWLLRAGGLEERPGNLRTCGIAHGGSARWTPWARDTSSVVLLAEVDGGWSVTELQRDRLDIAPGQNLAGEQRDTVGVPSSGLTWAPVSEDVAVEFDLRLMLSRACAASGAMQRIVELSLAHVRSREQFGRPIGRFQLVQSMVSTIAAEAELVHAVTGAAAETVARQGFLTEQAQTIVLSAASCVATAGPVVVRLAHQVHGAMGYTREHPLHHFTNRVLAWRKEPWTPQATDQALLTSLAGKDAVALWARLVDTSSSSEGDS